MLWIGLIGSVIAYDWFSGRETGRSEPWSLALGVAALLGLLAGYDVYSRIRETGVLRFLLLSPMPLWRITWENVLGAATLTSGGVLLFSTWLLARGAPAPAIGAVGTIFLLLLAGFLFTTYLQAFSLFMPRDAAAVGGLILVFLGRVPLASMAPSWTPDWASGVVRVLGTTLPATWRLEEAMALQGASWFGVVLVVAQIGVMLGVIRMRLATVTLRQRQPSS